jgi:uncharacterized zinc-type alcohol dehydrogenase-like protein
MTEVNAYAAFQPTEPLKPFKIERRNPRPNDVVIEIAYCGICHSDLHLVKGEWGGSNYPMVPGHEIVGKVSQVGSAVTKYKIGDHVGVGCFVDSCRQCPSCQQKMEQYCDHGMMLTYNYVSDKEKTPTYGGYSTQIVVDENYVLKIPKNIPLENAAPLLCAGITTYSPLRNWDIKPGDKVGVMGLGGLGHMAVKLAAAMGAEVTVFSTSTKKKEDALRMGAKNFVNTSQQGSLAAYANYFKLIINTISADININDYLGLLKLDGTMVQVGVPEKPFMLGSFPLILRRRNLSGSLIGGTKETQEMLDFCGEKNISADIELIPAEKINEAYARMLKGDVKYRFVIDTNSMRNK